MKAIEFEEVNVRIAKNQPEYETLPVYHDGTETGTITSCFELTPEEIDIIVTTGKIWYTQLTFGRPMQAMSIGVHKPNLLKELYQDSKGKDVKEGDLLTIHVMGWQLTNCAIKRHEHTHKLFIPTEKFGDIDLIEAISNPGVLIYKQ